MMISFTTANQLVNKKQNLNPHTFYYASQVVPYTGVANSPWQTFKLALDGHSVFFAPDLFNESLWDPHNNRKQL